MVTFLSLIKKNLQKKNHTANIIPNDEKLKFSTTMRKETTKSTLTSLGGCPHIKKLPMDVYSSFLHNYQILDTTHFSRVVFNSILFSAKEKSAIQP